MPTGPLLPDHDQPEKAPVILPVFAAAGFSAFSPIPGAACRRVVVPFPLRPVVDPVRGVVLRGLWASGPSYGPDDVLGMAARREGGFRFEDATKGV